MIRTFSKVLRHSTKSSDNLFQLQVQSSVANSRLLLFDRFYIQNQPKQKDTLVYLGLYNNDYMDPFLVLYKDALRLNPADVFWLRDCVCCDNGIITDGDISFRLLHHGKMVTFMAERQRIVQTWKVHVKEEIARLRRSENRHHGNATGSASVSYADYTSKEKLVVLRKSGKLRPSVCDMENTFKDLTLDSS